MDLRKLDTVKAANQGATLEITHPGTGDVLDGMTITLLGSDSDIYRKEVRKRTEQNLNNRKKQSKVDLEEAEIRGCELLAKLTKSWTGIEEGKQEVECTFDNAVRIYREYRWIREQCEAFIADRANFINT